MPSTGLRWPRLSQHIVTVRPAMAVNVANQPQRAKNTKRVSDDLGERLHHNHPRYTRDIALNYDINNHNHGFPMFEGDKDLPVEITTPFKYATQAPIAVDDDTIIMVIQKEGGESWGEEIPCKEYLLILKKDPQDGVFREKAAPLIGGKKYDGCWRLVTDISVDRERESVTLKWWCASYTAGGGSLDMESKFSYATDLCGFPVD